MPPLELILNVAVSGILTGLVSGLMALGLSVMFGVVRVVKVAHGEMMTIAMYLAVTLFTAFRLDPPMEGRDRYGFVPTDSELHRLLAAAAEPGHPAFAVLELKRHPAEGGKNWLEITAIVAPNWWPESE